MPSIQPPMFVSARQRLPDIKPEKARERERTIMHMMREQHIIANTSENSGFQEPPDAMLMVALGGEIKKHMDANSKKTIIESMEHVTLV